MFKEMDFRNNEIEKTQIQKLIDECLHNSINHGWLIKWDFKKCSNEIISIGEMISVIHGELSEAFEEYRKDDLEKFSIEIADVFITLFSLCGFLQLNIEHDIYKKINIIKNRPFKHGRKNY